MMLYSVSNNYSRTPLMLGFDMFHWMDPFEIFYSDSRRQNNNIYGVELDKLMFSSSRN